LPSGHGFHNVCAVRTLPRRWVLIGTAAIALAVTVTGAAALSSVAWAGPAKLGAGAHAHHGRAGKARHAPARHAGAAHGRAPQKKHASDERHVAAMKGGLPNIQALGALVIDENGRELYARNPDKERPIASISKLAATLVVMDKGLELEGLSTIARGDLDAARGGAKSRLLEGMTLSNRDLLHAALMGSDNRAIPALGRAVKLTPTQLAAAMTAKAKSLGLKNTRFHDPTGLSTENVSTPRETIVMLKAVMRHPVLGPITHRLEYDAHPVGKPPITYHNTYKPAVRNTIQVMGGKTGYNDDARYCLVIATKIDGHNYYMSFLANEGKLTRFGDVARVADWVLVHKPQPPKTVTAAAPSPAGTTTLVSAATPVRVRAPVAAHPPAGTATGKAATSVAGPEGASAATAGDGASTAAAASAAPSDFVTAPPAPTDNSGDKPGEATYGPVLPIGIAAPPPEPSTPPAPADPSVH
jgi:D-alanyl-D-alanine endopeptidase (penicillin-binding protein 7)